MHTYVYVFIFRLKFVDTFADSKFIENLYKNW